MAFVRSAANIGYFAGGALAAIPLAIGTHNAYVAIAFINAAGMLLNGAFIIRMPDPIRHFAAAPKQRAREVFRDKPFLVLAGLGGVLVAHATMFTEVVPLWLVTHTDAPHVMLAVLFGINTILAIALQVPASRGADTLPGIAKLLRRSGFAVAISCIPLYLSGRTSGVLTMVLLAAGIVLTTASELWQSAGNWGINAEVPPADRRGAYSGALRMGSSAQNMVAPAALTWLAVYGGGLGWLAIAAIFTAASLAVGPVVGWVARTPRVTSLEPGHGGDQASTPPRGEAVPHADPGHGNAEHGDRIDDVLVDERISGDR